MLVLKSSDDPRDALERARLADLLKWAAKNSVEIPPAFQDKAIIVRQILRQRGLARIPLAPQPPLGSPPQGKNFEAPPADTGPSIEVDAVADLMRQVQAAPPAPTPPAKKAPAIVGLRQECKRRGIKFTTTDKAADLRAKLDGKQDPA